MRSKRVRYLACVLVAAAFALPVGAMSVGGANDETKGWTLLMYWDADNSLEFCTEFAMSTWEAALTDDSHVNIVALVDILSEDGIWIYNIEDGERNLVATWDEMNTSDPATLETFIEYGMANFPASKTMLVLQDHGYGWRGICQDESNGDVLMSMHGVGEALKNAKRDLGKGVDLLAFDACNMMSIEGVYELRDAVPYVVGSETMVPFDGLPYEMFITDLMEDWDMSAPDLATNIVEEYVRYYSSKWEYKHIMRYSQDFATIAAFDMSKMDALGRAFGDLSSNLLPLIEDHMMEVEDARGYALVGTWTNMAGYEWMPDVYTFVEGLRSITGHPMLTSAIDSFEAAFDAALLSEAHSRKYHDTVHGLNFWFPPSMSQYNMMGWTWARQFVYCDVGLDLVEMTSWNDCLMAYYSAE